MSGKIIPAPDLNMSQNMADIIAAKSCITEALNNPPKLAKYLRGQAGYHIQQAAEKMIKIQIYANLQQVDNSKVFRHDLSDLVSYARSENVSLIIPDYVNSRMQIISSWEAEGRYDTHMVVKINTLTKSLEEIENWADQLKKCGYR